MAGLSHVPGFQTLAHTMATTWHERVREPFYDESVSEEIFEMTDANLNSIPLSFIFSGIGSRQFSLQNLIQLSRGNPTADLPFSVSYDHFGGKIRLSAFKTLGSVSVINEEKSPLRKSASLIQYLEKTSTLLGESSSITRMNSSQCDVPEFKTVYSLQIDRTGASPCTT